MGLTVNVYRSAEYAGGSREELREAKRVTVVNASGPSWPDENTPAVLVVPGNGSPATVHAVPAVYEDGEWKPKRKGGYAMGGSYIATSDGRLSELVRRMTGLEWYGAVALHDHALFG